jgi:hypothetical protein
MTKTITAAILTLLATAAHAQAPDPSCAQPCQATSAPPPPAPLPVDAYPSPPPPLPPTQANASTNDDDTGWHAPAGRRFFHGFRIGAMVIGNYDQPDSRRDGMSLKDKYGLTSPYMMVLGYEGFYRIVGHSWLNVILVGNVSVAGLDQSKFIPAASGLIGVELQHSFQIGAGVNVLPDPVAPSHAIIAAGWTPRVGSIQTPIHFFYVPDHGDPMTGTAKNWRAGATIGLNW